MIKQIMPEEVFQQLKDGQKLSLIDVREDEEVAEGMISEAKHIPLGQLEDRINEISKDEEHIMICRSDGRSGKACKLLKAKGFKVKNMVGGMLTWEAKYGK
ncbi:rhodanese-like domain-containing protein [Camelliibacillus cellulosilyticus]|uniref:Rhodanese-like domain-containing protein n=1 Tax=Camelliibacillus cellulosilyticus TaxID=2174486 RepID=A0ABV9GN14_9BACL